MGLGCVKTKSHLVVMPAKDEFLRFFALSATTSLKILGAVIPRRVFTQPGSSSAVVRGQTKSDLVVMPSEGRIFAFFCSERDHKPQNSGCGYTTQNFHTAWAITGHTAPFR